MQLTLLLSLMLRITSAYNSQGHQAHRKCQVPTMPQPLSGPYHASALPCWDSQMLLAHVFLRITWRGRSCSISNHPRSTSRCRHRKAKCITQASWGSEWKRQVWSRTISFQNLCSWLLGGYFPAQACQCSHKDTSQHSHLCFQDSFLPPLFLLSPHLPPGQVGLFSGCLLQRSTRAWNLIRKARIPQRAHHSALWPCPPFLPNSGPQQPGPLSQSLEELGNSDYSDAHGLKRRTCAFLLFLI